MSESEQEGLPEQKVAVLLEWTFGDGQNPSGIWLTTKENWRDELELWQKAFKHFGNKEETVDLDYEETTLELDDIDDFLDGIKVEEITEEEYESMRRIFGYNEVFGFFPEVPDYEEEEEEEEESEQDEEE